MPSLLPSNATGWEKLMSALRDDLPVLEPAYEGIRTADANPPAGFLPFLVWQYGLGEIAPFVDDATAIIDTGIEWQRVRGTPDALRKALAWPGYDFATLVEEIAHLTGAPSIAARRRRWNRFMLELDKVRVVETPDLERIAGLGQASVAERSRFARAFRGYDVRAGEADFRRADACLTDDHSGGRLPGIAPQWSFGRSYAIDATPSQGDLTAAGVYDADPNVTAQNLAAGEHWVVFKAADASVIGYGRATVHAVAAGSTYTIGGASWAPAASGATAAYAFTRTPFGAGAGATCATVALLVGAARGAGVKPGALWVEPGGLIGGTELAATAQAIPFGETVREHVAFLLRLT